MSVDEMYEDFRSQYPEWTKSADARHIEILGTVETEGAFLWFESLAGALNAQMGFPEKRAEISVIFRYSKSVSASAAMRSRSALM